MRIRLTPMVVLGAAVAVGAITGCGDDAFDQIPSGDAWGVLRCSGKGNADPCATPEEVKTKLVGRWVHCSGHPTTGERPGYSGTLGIEFLADGRYFILVEGQFGMVRGRGFNDEGRWSHPRGASPNQIDLRLPHGGSMPALATFRKGPAQLQLDSTTMAAVYGRLPDVGPGGPPLDPPSCKDRGSSDPMLTVAQASANLLGQWLHCSGEKLGPVSAAHADERGIEFLSNGRFRLLVAKSGSDQLVPGKGFDLEGSWSLSGTGSDFDVSLKWDGLVTDHASSLGGRLAFRKSPRLLRIGHSATFEAVVQELPLRARPIRRRTPNPPIGLRHR
jgi:hypothetical protein